MDRGDLDKPTQLGTFCGTEIPPNQRSMSNSLEINFHSDGAREATGFVADWTMVEGLCGGRLIGTSGLVSTPGYPSPGISGRWKLYFKTSPYIPEKSFSKRHELYLVS